MAIADLVERIAALACREGDPEWPRALARAAIVVKVMRATDRNDETILADVAALAPLQSRVPKRRARP